MISFGIFKLDSRTKKEQEKDDDVEYTYKLVFKDPRGSTLTIKCEESDYDDYEIGDTLDPKKILIQETLTP